MASQTSSGAIDADLGLYVHVPFCEHVCPYCDFDVIGVRRLAERDEREFVDLVLREFDLARERVAGREIATVYFGGGTPALLSPASISRLLAAFAAELRFADGRTAKIGCSMWSSTLLRVGLRVTGERGEIVQRRRNVLRAGSRRAVAGVCGGV